jgi:hypothetical protein
MQHPVTSRSAAILFRSCRSAKRCLRGFRGGQLLALEPSNSKRHHLGSLIIQLQPPRASDGATGRETGLFGR